MKQREYNVKPKVFFNEYTYTTKTGKTAKRYYQLISGKRYSVSAASVNCYIDEGYPVVIREYPLSLS